MIESKIKVSVIVPVYNIEKYISKCLDSILNQTLQDIEIICVNDGSTDKSTEILNEYALNYNNIIIVNKENAGPGAARNSGIKIARGEYIGFVDGDDFISTQMFEVLYTKAKKYDADIAITNSYLYYTKTNEKNVFRDNALFDKLEDAKTFTAKEYPEILTIVGMWDRIFKHDFVNEIGFKNPEGRFYEDHLPSFESSVLAHKIVVVNQPLYYYRQQREGSTVNREAKYDYYKFDFLQDYIEIHKFLKSTNEYEIYQEQFLRYKIPLAIMHQNNMVSLSNFKIFFKEMKKEIMLEDYQKLEQIDYMGWKLLKIYIKCLKRNQLIKCIVFFFLNRIVSRDNLFVKIRIPKTAKVLKIKRCHFYQRFQIESMNLEISKFKNENTANSRRIEALIQQLIDIQSEEKRQ